MKYSMNLMLHVLRLLINVTNGDEPCCENLNQSGSIQVLIQNFIQFYGHCRSYNPEEPGTRIQCTPSPRGERTYEGLEDSEEIRDGGPKHISIDAANRQERAAGTSSLAIKIENDANGWYDILLLSIGLLINMLETNPARREQVTSSAIGLDCRAIGDCFHNECRCEKSKEALERLVEIYNTEATISEMTENQVLAAYLALLIGCIVGGNPECESRLYRKINGQSLVPMLELLNEFAAFNQAVQVKHLELEIDDDQAMFTQISQPALSDYSLSRQAYSETTSINCITTNPDTLDGPQTFSISFTASKAAETQHSFFQIIGVLQDIEMRFSTG
ncbi:hypothetical protein BGX27_000898 [Mortierella sp. AM989]|nr:hypothetical protein BGX27_000898 [Mortierella sp. AM989]